MNTALILLLMRVGSGEGEVVVFGPGIVDAIQLFTPGGVVTQLVTGGGAASIQLFTPGAESVQGGN